MKAKINTKEVEVNRIRIDYIKPGHEGVQLLIEYYNAIPAASTLRAPPSCLTTLLCPNTTLWSLHSMLKMKTQGLYL